MIQWKHAIRQIEGEARQVELRRLFNQIIAGGGEATAVGKFWAFQTAEKRSSHTIQAEAKRWLDETKNNVTQVTFF